MSKLLRGMGLAALGYAAVFAVIAVDAGADQTAYAPARNSSSSVTPAPSPPPEGGALPVRPAGGGGCIIGLNCGCIPFVTCPGSHRQPRATNGDRGNVRPPAPPP